MDVQQTLENLGLTLPPAPRPRGNYLPYVRDGHLLFLSGQLPLADGRLRYAGTVGETVSVEEAYDAARLCGLNVLAQIRTALGSFHPLKQLLRVEGRVRCAPGFTDLAEVVNGASDLFAQVLGKRAGHARAVTGHRELSLGTPVEIVVTASVAP